MRKIAEQIAAKMPRCPVCNARGRVGYHDHTCSGICHRAHVRGISRGLQIELEARRDNRRPYPETLPEAEWIPKPDQITGYELLDLEFDRKIGALFDNPSLVRV